MVGGAESVILVSISSLGDVRIRTHQEVSDDRKVSVVEDSVSAPQSPLDRDDIRLLNRK